MCFGGKSYKAPDVQAPAIQPRAAAEPTKPLAKPKALGGLGDILRRMGKKTLTIRKDTGTNTP